MYKMTNMGIVNTEDQTQVETAIQILESLLQPESVVACELDLEGQYELSIHHHKRTIKIIEQIIALKNHITQKREVRFSYDYSTQHAF